jgi:hypothetical protein
MLHLVYVKLPLDFKRLRKLEFSRQIFEKYSNIKRYENPPSGTRAVTYGQT